MFDEMFPAQRAASLSQSTLRPYTPPGKGLFTGFGDALSDIVPNATLTGVNAWSGVLDAYGKASAYAEAATDLANLTGDSKYDMGVLKAQTIDQIGNDQLGPALRAEAKKYAPDPAAVGTAGQLVFGVGATLAKAGVYSLAGPAAPFLMGADAGVNRADELKDQGVDATTANLAGAMSGVAAGVGMKLPAAMGATRLQSAGIGAVVNPALNVAEVGGIRMLLQHADYARIAQQYEPFDPLNLTVAAVTGAAFGAAFQRGAKGKAGVEATDAAPPLSPDEHAAALTMNEVHTRGGDTLTQPGDLRAANAAADAQALARQQMDAGQQVSLPSLIGDQAVDPILVDAAQRSLAKRMSDTAPEALAFPEVQARVAAGIESDITRAEAEYADLSARAADIADVGQVSRMQSELRDVEARRTELNSEGAVQALTKEIQASGPHISYKQARGRAEQQVAQTIGDLDGRIERLRDAIDQNASATKALQDLPMLAQRIVDLRAQRAAIDAPASLPTAISVAVREMLDTATVNRRPAETVSPTAVSVSEKPAGGLASDQVGVVGRLVDSVSRLLGREESAPSAPEAALPKPETPEQTSAFSMVSRNPDTLIPTGDLDAEGKPVLARAGDLMQRVADVEKQTKAEAAAFEAAVNCALRFPR